MRNAHDVAYRDSTVTLDANDFSGRLASAIVRYAPSLGGRMEGSSRRRVARAEPLSTGAPHVVLVWSRVEPMSEDEVREGLRALGRAYLSADDAGRRRMLAMVRDDRLGGVALPLVEVKGEAAPRARRQT